MDTTLEEQARRRPELRYDIEPGDADEVADAELLSHIKLGNYPLGKYLRGRGGEEDLRRLEEDVNWLLKPVESLIQGELDPREMVSTADHVSEDIVPLHRLYLVVMNSEHSDHGLSNNQEIAARTFPYLWEYSHPTMSGRRLPSTKLQEIISEEISTPALSARLDVENPHNQTVNRVMDFIAEFSEDLVNVDRDAHPKELVIDEDAWADYTDRVGDSVTISREVTD